MIKKKNNSIKTKKTVLEWMLRTLMSETISERKQSAFMEWLANDEHSKMKHTVIDSVYSTYFDN